MAQPNSGEGDAPQAKRARLCEEALEKQTAEYKCPITRELMEDPVVAADGRLYERKELETWLATHTTSPVTNEEMARGPLVSCPPVRNAIEALVASGTLDAGDEASWQLRRGERLEARGDHEAAAACYERASALGNSVGKYRVAMKLLREAADDGCQEAAERLSPSAPREPCKWTMESLVGRYWGTNAPIDSPTLRVDSGIDESYNVVNCDMWDRTYFIMKKIDGEIVLKGDEVSDFYLDEEESTETRLVWYSDVPQPHYIWWMKLSPDGRDPSKIGRQFAATGDARDLSCPIFIGGRST